MDIHDKLLETVDANDPQFKILLNNAIEAEIASLEEELAAKRALNERKRVELSSILERRKSHKKNIQEKSELIEVMDQATKCLQDYSVQMIETLALTKNMLDEDSLRQLAVLSEEEKLINQLEKDCLESEAEYEKNPLAQERKAARLELLKVEVKLGMAEANIKDMDRNYEIYKNIQEKMEQKSIIALAEVWLNHREHVEEWKLLKQEFSELNSKIAEQEQEIEAFIKEKADKEKQNALARFQMPPPVMNKELLETIFCQPYILPTKSNVPDAMIDSFNDNASISSSIFEEMCKISDRETLVPTEVEQLETEQDVVSIASSGFNQDSQNTKEFSPTRSVQSDDERSSKKFENSAGFKKRNKNSGAKVKETPKRTANSPRVNPLSKKSRSDSLILDNTAKERKTQGQSAKSSANNKAKKSSEKQEQNPNFPKAKIPEEKSLEDDCVTMENVASFQSDLHSENRSLCGSINSFSFSEANINETAAPNEALHSDLSIQSLQEDQNNSIVFTPDELSNAETDAGASDPEAPPPPQPPAPMPSGIFGSQNRRSLNFHGLFFK